MAEKAGQFMSQHTSKGARDITLFIAALSLLFLTLASLSAFLIAGESRRSRILVEYEADRIASGLLDSFRSQGELDPGLLDRRILGFGVFREDGQLVAGLGDAPRVLELPEEAQAFRYDEAGRSVSLVRPLGAGRAGGPGAKGMMSRMGRRGMGSGGLFYLSMGIGDYYRSRSLYQAATVVAPLLILGLAAAFLSLLSSNLRFRRRAQEQDTLARLGESARTLAHEIRNPLGAIRLQTGLLRKRLGADSGRELDAIDEETERLNDLTRRVGEYLQNPKGKSEPIRLGDFLAEIARRSPFPIALSGEAVEESVLFDPELLRSVLENLARNAYESYGETGGEVEVATSREGNRVVIAVSDRGAGIEKELMGKIFDPFFTSKTRGSGIGLPLARRFVEAAGGSLGLAPRPGGGTEAKVSLPRGGRP
jgi:two-component system, NtrC family, sensor histidine kinase HydH